MYLLTLNTINRLCFKILLIVNRDIYAEKCLCKGIVFKYCSQILQGASDNEQPDKTQTLLTTRSHTIKKL